LQQSKKTRIGDISPRKASAVVHRICFGKNKKMTNLRGHFLSVRSNSRRMSAATGSSSRYKVLAALLLLGILAQAAVKVDYEIHVAPEDSNQRAFHSKRNLQTADAPIRIYFDLSELHKVSLMYQAYVDVIGSALNMTQKFYSDLLHVAPQPGNKMKFVGDKCGAYEVPSNFKEQGAEQADVYVFVNWYFDSMDQLDGVSYAYACQVGASDVKGRVQFGVINFNLYKLEEEINPFQVSEYDFHKLTR
jgi:hypothetical protein